MKHWLLTGSMALALLAHDATAAGQQRRADMQVSFTVVDSCVIDSQGALALSCSAGTPYRILHQSAARPTAAPQEAQPAQVSGDTIYF